MRGSVPRTRIYYCRYCGTPIEDARALAQITCGSPECAKAWIDEWRRLKFHRDYKDRKKRKRRDWTKAELDLLIEMVDKGYTKTEIASELDRPLSSVGAKIKRLREAGLLTSDVMGEPRRRGRPPSVSRDEFLRRLGAFAREVYGDQVPPDLQVED